MKRDRSTDSLEKLAISCSHHMSPPNRLRTGVIAAATPTSGGSAGEGTPDAHMSDSLGDTTEMMVFEHNNNNNNNNTGEEETTSPPIPGEPNININKHKPDPEYDPETEAPNHGRKVTPDSPCAAFGLSRRQILKGLACAGTAAVVEATLAPAAAKSKQPPPVIHEQQGDEEAERWRPGEVLGVLASVEGRAAKSPRYRHDVTWAQFCGTVPELELARSYDS